MRLHGANEERVKESLGYTCHKVLDRKLVLTEPASTKLVLPFPLKHDTCVLGVGVLDVTMWVGDPVLNNLSGKSESDLLSMGSSTP